MSEKEMEISVNIGGQPKTMRVPAGSKIEDVIRACGLNVSAQIVLRGKTPVPVDDDVLAGDELRIIETFSGG